MMESLARPNSKTHGLWAATAPPAPPTQVLADNEQVDVAIVGGGYTGCSAALFLAERGKQVALLEAADIGFGGAGRNVGLVNAGLWLMPDDVLEILGEDRGERLIAYLGGAPAFVFDTVARLGLECEAVRNGTLHCAVGPKGLLEVKKRAEQWSRRGADVELLPARKTELHTGTSAYAGSLLDRRAGTIQPLAYVRGLARAAIAAGATIYTGSPVIDYADVGTAWQLVTPGGKITATSIIVATDAYSHGAWSNLRREQIELPYFNMATVPLSAAQVRRILPERQGAWDTRQVLSSFRMDAQHRLIFGSVGALRGTGTAIHQAWAQRELARLFPELDGLAFEHRWYGTIGMTSDAVPRLHQLGRNIISISGYNGRGIAPGTIFGRDLARLVLGEIAIEDIPLPVSVLSTARARLVKGATYELGSQLAHFSGSRFSSFHLS